MPPVMNSRIANPIVVSVSAWPRRAPAANRKFCLWLAAVRTMIMLERLLAKIPIVKSVRVSLNFILFLNFVIAGSKYPSVVVLIKKKV